MLYQALSHSRAQSTSHQELTQIGVGRVEGVYAREVVLTDGLLEFRCVPHAGAIIADPLLIAIGLCMTVGTFVVLTAFVFNGASGTGIPIAAAGGSSSSRAAR